MNPIDPLTHSAATDGQAQESLDTLDYDALLIAQIARCPADPIAAKLGWPLRSWRVREVGVSDQFIWPSASSSSTAQHLRTWRCWPITRADGRNSSRTIHGDMSGRGGSSDRRRSRVLGDF